MNLIEKIENIEKNNHSFMMKSIMFEDWCQDFLKLKYNNQFEVFKELEKKPYQRELDFKIQIKIPLEKNIIVRCNFLKDKNNVSYSVLLGVVNELQRSNASEAYIFTNTDYTDIFLNLKKDFKNIKIFNRKNLYQEIKKYNFINCLQKENL